MDMLMVNGHMENVLKPYDFERLIEQYMGEEAAKYFREYQEKADEEVRYAREGKSAELSIYKEDVKDMREAFTNIAIDAKELLEMLSSDHTNRNRAFLKAMSIVKVALERADKAKVFGPAF